MYYFVYHSLFRKPCYHPDGVFVFGIQRCRRLTRRRMYVGGEIFPICREHQYEQYDD
jgi:hypothetical protein